MELHNRNAPRYPIPPDLTRGGMFGLTKSLILGDGCKQQSKKICQRCK